MLIYAVKSLLFHHDPSNIPWEIHPCIDQSYSKLPLTGMPDSKTHPDIDWWVYKIYFHYIPKFSAQTDSETSPNYMLAYLPVYPHFTQPLQPIMIIAYHSSHGQWNL